MKVLVVGSGGREHALAWKLSRDRGRPEVFCAPGNAGTSRVATNVPVGAEDVAGLVAWAVRNRPDWTIVGPEAPLCAGLTDALAERELKAFGPCRAAAQMEGSKVFAKEVMEAAGVPTASSRSFVDCEAAQDWARRACGPLVVKADGLAAGKGVAVCMTAAEAESAIRAAMVDAAFGDAGKRILVEQYLEGEEVSILALIDGERAVMLASSQDHKRIFDGDQGPNTGGMGAYSPAPVMTDDLWPVIRERVFDPVLRELRRRRIVYRGVLYAGVMITADGPKVLEFNCRFGDPETQAILPRFAGDLLPALAACVEGGLSDDLVAWRSDPCVCVVMASGGYPGHYPKGKLITGLPETDAEDAVVFHAGTATVDGRIVTAGGRVLGVTALGRDLHDAIRRAYVVTDGIRFEGAHFRRDIGARALVRLSGR